MFKCNKCETLYSTKKQADNCCKSEDYFHLNPNISKDQFILEFINLQKDLKKDAITNNQFKDLLTPKELAQHLWLKFSEKKSMNENQFFEYLNSLLRQITISDLCDKKLLDTAGLGQNGQVMYKLTDLGKKVGEQAFNDLMSKNKKE